MIRNARQEPRIFYGLHMAEGVAEYPEHKDQNGNATRILILENALKEMTPSFVNKPVYVFHVDEVNLDTLQEDADGFVVESFYNQLDGKYWTKFIIISDKGHEAIRNGWKLSNAYTIKDSKGAGNWHAVDYNREVTRAEYTHLAIVPNPRYSESVILTPDQFKDYNALKERKLESLKNSKGDTKMKFKFWEKKEVKNSVDLEGATVSLQDGTDKPIEEIINEWNEHQAKKVEAEKAAAALAAKKAEEDKKKNDAPPKPGEGDKKDEPEMANGEHFVNVGEHKMSVNQLLEKYNGMVTAKAAEEEKKNAEDEKKKKDDEEKKNAEDEKKKKDEDDKKNHFESLKNAMLQEEADKPLEIYTEKVARGKSKYGSSK